MGEKIKKIGIIAVILLDLFFMYLSFVAYPNQIKNSEQKISENQAKISDYKVKTNKLTYKSYQEVIRKKVKYLNLDNTENTLRKNYTEAITDAYNVKTEDEYNSKEKDIASKLGTDHLISTVLSKTIVQKVKGKDYPQSNGLNSVSVSFGKYNVDTKILPVNILVDYKPVVDDSSATVAVNSKKVMYTFNYNVKDNSDGDVTFTELVSTK
ncbi:hypothetical protein FYL25_09065 [Lactobacillus salivarius]|uniref:Uncharacterized protein n=1 Tax=Ligilactobacillus salivarius TaxID=1624 RepID=A0A6N9IT29_9LACO|nr:hypothetical protein [Ligilactobacillus salivarius]MYY65536.1 hypothetical protein [Ligilactobacillus salivarius]